MNKTMFNKIKQIKDLRSQAKTMQGELEQITKEASSKGVTVTINGNQKVISVTIEDSMLENKGKLEEACKDAFNSAVKAIQKDMALKMKDMGGLDMLKDMGF
jgi:DNA-binding YbaB/EbfC family protein